MKRSCAESGCNYPQGGCLGVCFRAIPSSVKRRHTVRWHGVKSRQRRCKRYVEFITPLETAIRNAATAPKQSRDKLALADLSTLDTITRGKGRLSDFRYLVDICNLCEVLAKDYRIGGEEVLAAVKEAEAAFLSCARRIETTGKIGFSGPELAAVREMLEWAAAQREAASRGVYLAAIKLLGARVKGGSVTVEMI